jgi:NAD(P)-dependent dehydrogenase (short-subunit alcohol dehydrogenase family)
MTHQSLPERTRRTPSVPSPLSTTQRCASLTPIALAAAYAPYIKGSVVLVTGISPDTIGSAFLNAIAKSMPAELILAGRSAVKVRKSAETLAADHPGVKIRALKLDLSSLDEAREAAETVNEWAEVPHVDILVHSAGIMAVDWNVSPDGYESQLAVNHLAPFLFTNLIMEKLLRSKGPRVVMASSSSHRLSPIRFADYNFEVGFPAPYATLEYVPTRPDNLHRMGKHIIIGKPTGSPRPPTA